MLQNQNAIGRSFHFSLRNNPHFGILVFACSPPAGSAAAVKITVTKARRDFVANDAAAGNVRQIAFQAAADFDPHGAIVAGDQQQRAVVVMGAADLPRFCYARGC